MPGKLIFVSGLSGSGKTTLIGGALQQLPWVSYLKTYTTRPQRPGEEASHEYVFVTKAEYAKLQKASTDWDHTEYGGFLYGADAAAVKASLKAGKTIICAVAPDLGVVQVMEELYATKPTTVWIKVPKDVTKPRIYDDDIRDSRNEDFAISTNFDFNFEPQGNVEKDIMAFSQFLTGLAK